MCSVSFPFVVVFSQTSFFRMVECKDDHGDIVNREELKDLLDKLPPPPDPSEELTPTSEMSRDIGSFSSSNDPNFIQSPKVPKRKRPFKSMRKQNSTEIQATEVYGRFESSISTQLNALAVENRSEEFKREFIRRLSQVFQGEEDVLVISLGYSAIECPGMLSEEKVALLFCCYN